MSNSVKTCSVEEFKKILDSNSSIQLIDVRENAEYEAIRIKNSKLLPLSSFLEKLNEIEKDKPSYYLCAVGKRAMRAAEYLYSIGYKDLYVIDGGLKAWVESGFPVERS